MGKKSRKPKHKKKPTSTVELANGLSKLHIPSDTASCWICLDEGPDDSGQPIRRDCSCRGDSGWVHLSCIVDYARSKSEEWLKKNGEAYWGTGMTPNSPNGFNIETATKDDEPWMKCPNCNQGYLNQFAVDVYSACVEFTIERFPCNPEICSTPELFPCDPFKYTQALLGKLITIYHSSDQGELNTVKMVADGGKLSDEIIAIAAQMKTSLNHNRIQQSRDRITMIEAETYKLHGDLILKGIANEKQKPSPDRYSEVAKLYEKGLELSKPIGDLQFLTSEIEMSLGKVQQMTNHGSLDLSTRKQNVRYLRNLYNRFPSDASKLELAMALLSTGCVIESQRMVSEIVNNCRRVNGINHSQTTGVEESLSVVSTRRVLVHGRGEDPYKLLKYIDGDKCIVRGPMTFEKFGEGEGKTLTVHIDDLVLIPPVPVVCQGLKGASHLNGKIGDVRVFNSEVQRYQIHFEDPKLKSALVKQENLRVLFDLPDKE